MFRLIFLRVCLILGLVAIGLVATLSVQAQQSTELGEKSITIPANGQASLRFDTFCLEFGKNFPRQLTVPQGRASAPVLRVLKTAIQDGLVESNPLQTQLAIWHEVTGSWSYDATVVDHTVAQSLLNKAPNVTISAVRAEGVALDQAVANGTITITSGDFAFTKAPTARPDGQPYRGRGILQIKNNTAQAVTLYFPFGLVFKATNASEQDMVAYATEMQPTATPTPKATPRLNPTSVPQITPPSASGRAPAPTQAALTGPQRLPATGAETSSTRPIGLLLTIGGIVCLGIGIILLSRSYKPL